MLKQAERLSEVRMGIGLSLYMWCDKLIIKLKKCLSIRLHQILGFIYNLKKSPHTKKTQFQNKFRRNALKRCCGGNHCMVSGSHLKAVELMNILRHPQMQVKTLPFKEKNVYREDLEVLSSV